MYARNIYACAEKVEIKVYVCMYGYRTFVNEAVEVIRPFSLVASNQLQIHVGRQNHKPIHVSKDIPLHIYMFGSQRSKPLPSGILPGILIFDQKLIGYSDIVPVECIHTHF